MLIILPIEGWTLTSYANLRLVNQVLMSQCEVHYAIPRRLNRISGEVFIFPRCIYGWCILRISLREVHVVAEVADIVMGDIVFVACI